MGFIRTTPRLILRPLTQNDWEDLAQILQDDQVMYAYGHHFQDADVQQWLDRQQQRYRQHGFGLWAAVEKQSGHMVGQVGLTLQPCLGRQVLEVGYLLKKRYWHRGYAREAAASCVQYAFCQLGATRVHAIIKCDNQPSLRVAQALGMTCRQTFTTRYYAGDMRHYLYAIDAPPQ